MSRPCDCGTYITCDCPLPSKKDKRIAELLAENKQLREDNEALHQHSSMLERRCDFWNTPLIKITEDSE